MALEPGAWQQELRRRIGTLWALKMFSTMAGIAGFFYAYFWVMRHPLSTVTVMPLTWIDALVGFHPWTFFVYITLWVYISLGPALARDVGELAAFGAACLAIAAIGLAIFMLLPTKVPEFAIDWSLHPSLEFLKRVDVSGNACPSLHVAFCVFAAAVLHVQLTAMRARRWLLAFNVLWALVILYSTMATRQHVALDVIAGVALGGAVSLVYVRALARRRRGA